MAINDEKLLKTCMVAAPQNYPGLFSFRLKDVLVQNILGTTESPRHTQSNGKNPLEMAIRGTFNETANDKRSYVKKKKYQ